jgi:hypothetical protein
MRYKIRVRQAVAIAIAAACVAGTARADEREDLETLRQTTLRLIEALVQQGILTKEKADELIKQAAQGRPAAAAAAAGAASVTGAAGPAGTGGSAGAAGTTAGATAAAKPNVVRVPYVPEFVRQEMKEEIRQEVLAQAKAERWGDAGALPEWISRIRWYGDLRLRYERDLYASGNAPALNIQQTNQSRAFTLLNTTEDQSYFRLRARLGMEAKVTDEVKAGFQITTGNSLNPLSLNQTLGNYFNNYQIVLNQAYVDYQPKEWIKVIAGRFANPWFSTDMVWNNDLSFDGLAVTLSPKFGEQSSGFLTAGAFPVQQVSSSSQNKWLYGVQAGGEWGPPGTYRAKLAAALYNYKNITGVANPPGLSTFDYTAPAFVQKGNTYFNISGTPGVTPLFGLAADYRILNLTGRLDWQLGDPVHVILTGDYARNLAFNSAAVSQKVGIPVAGQVNAYNARLYVGMPELKKIHDWQAFGGYRYIQRDAVLDAFNDSNFHLGGTDTKGYEIGANYAVGKDMWFTLRYLSADAISGPPLGIDVVQFDFNVRF